MRRFFRYLFNALTVVSLALAMLAASLWVRSHLTHTPGRWVPFGSASGRAFPALPLFASSDGGMFVASVPGRLLLVQQTASPAGEFDASHCGVFGSPSALIV